MERMLTTVEVGEVLRKRPRTIAVWCREGRLPGSYRPRGGSPWLIPPSAVLAARAVPDEDDPVIEPRGR